MRWQTGYCTNVHAGRTLDETLANLKQHAAAVRSAIAPQGTMGVGLWLSNNASQQMLAERRLAEFAGFLATHGLIPYTLNGFPYGDFHQEVVRHDVYLPTWWEAARTEYTLRLIDILDALLPAGAEGSISTVPIAWGSPPLTDAQFAAAAEQLLRVAEVLAEREQATGRLIYVCLEPEPGCALGRSDEMIRFFEQYLFRRGADRAQRYLRVCHDICHAAVMFEPQANVLRRYREAGVRVGKIQVSSAVAVDLENRSDDERAETLAALGEFAEQRYLHQTVVRSGGRETFYEDLPDALRAVVDPRTAAGQWRVHFHVPIYLEHFGLIGTSQNDIRECLRLAAADPDIKHLEVETYAWGVLPAALRYARLADGIAAEMRWLEQQLAE